MRCNAFVWVVGAELQTVLYVGISLLNSYCKARWKVEIVCNVVGENGLVQQMQLHCL